jgi:hypothetical protein
LSTLALEGADAADGPRAPAALRYADLVLLAVALPVFVVAGLPMLGYAAAAAAWLVQHAILSFAERRSGDALRRGERRAALGTIAVATLGRVWLVTLAILLVGLLAERQDGLAAAVLCAILVTAHLAGLAISRLFEEEGESA